jgi:hypothetical protein
MPKTNKQKRQTNFVFIITSAPKNEVHSIVISKSQEVRALQWDWDI